MILSLLNAYIVAFGINFFAHGDVANDNFRQMFLSFPTVIYTVIFFVIFQL